MTLQRQLSQEEWDLLAVVTDPVLLGEFLRNTADGSPTKEEWPKREFRYRWYQRDLLTDKNEYISLTAGRAVGKCNTMSTRVYTYPYGYVTIRDLLAHRKKHPFTPIAVYTMTEDKELIQRRLKISSNGKKHVYRLITQSGHVFEATDNHPLLTEHGWVMLSDLDITTDKIAVMTELPHTSGQELLAWEELRWIGYIMGLSKFGVETPLPLKFQKQVVELQKISEYFGTNFVRHRDGTYKLMHKKHSVLPHHGTNLIKLLRMTNIHTEGLVRIPSVVKAENLTQLRVLLEAYFSQYAEFTTDSVLVRVRWKTLAYDIQELLLRFGVESRVVQLDVETWEVSLLDAYAYYVFFKEFTLPGIAVRNLKEPVQKLQFAPFARFESIQSITPMGLQYTFALTVPDTHNYIADNLIVHNSLVLEDKIVHQAVNSDTEFPVTKESLLVTANVAQMTPILDRVVLRFSASPLLKDFLRNNVNRSKGTLDFPVGNTQYRLNARIAGSKGENNMIGQHVPKIIGDEMQVFSMAAFTQLGPTFNSWEPNIQQFYCGVNS